MARMTQRLSALQVSRAMQRPGKKPRVKPGMYADGDGLYLQVTEGGASWLLRYTRAGHTRYMGLGSLALYGLAEARAKALDAKRLSHEGVDPIEARRAVRAKAQLDAAKAISFEDVAEKHIAAHSAGWSAKTKSGWEATLATYAYPVIGSLPVPVIDTALVLRILEPLWLDKVEIAGRVRMRIEAVLDWAKARGWREGENPARWRGHLDKLLPARGRLRPVRHHAALPYAEIGEFMGKLREQEGIAADALELTILCALRTGEVIGAAPGEINIGDKVWTIPPERMKAGREHRVPLSDAAIAVVKRRLAAGGDYLFPGGKKGRPLSNMAMLVLLRRMGRDDVTCHGFRSTFRDWAAERTNFPREVAEMALAHTIPDATERAYRRGDLFEKRRRLMAAWATFCATPSQRQANVVTSLRQPA